jgi:hypothetical protein
MDRSRLSLGGKPMNLPLSKPQLGVLAGCGVLSLLILYQLAAPVSPQAPASITLPPLKPFAVPPAFVMPPPDRFAVIDDKPLFLPSRKPIAAANDKTPQASGPPPLPQITLVGVILDATTKLAMVKTASAAFAQSAPVGTPFGGWSISQIEPDRIVLHSDGFADHEILMNAAEPPPNTAPASGAPQH